MRFWPIAVILMLVATLAAPADAQRRNSLLGTWTRSDPGNYAAPASTIYMTFYGNGRYETRMIYGRSRGMDAGGVQIHGTWNQVGRNLVTYQENAYLLCSAGYCQPVPPQDPQFGRPKTVEFEVDRDRLFINGSDFYRAD